MKKIGHKSVWMVIGFGGFVKEEALLDIVGGKHGEIQRAQM